MSDHDRSPDDIQADIRRTRGRLDEALTLIEHRLEPQKLMDQGVDYLRDHGAREYIVNLGESVRQQPLPLALVGVGLAWLMLSDQRGKTVSNRALVTTSDSGRMQDHVKSAVSDAAAGVGDTFADARDKAVNSAADVSNKVSGAVSDMRDKVSSRAAGARDTVTRAAQQAGHSLSDGFGDARESVEHLGASARRGAERVKSGYLNVVDEQPLALGAVGLAIGALLAASAPRTRKESELMGGASDRLKEEVKEFGRDRLEQVKEVASAAVKSETPPDSAKDKEGTVNDKDVGGASGSSPSAPRSSSASSSTGSAEPRGSSTSTSQAFSTKASGTSGPAVGKSDSSSSNPVSGFSSAERKSASVTSQPPTGTSSTLSGSPSSPKT